MNVGNVGLCDLHIANTIDPVMHHISLRFIFRNQVVALIVEDKLIGADLVFLSAVHFHIGVVAIIDKGKAFLSFLGLIDKLDVAEELAICGFIHLVKHSDLLDAILKAIATISRDPFDKVERFLFGDVLIRQHRIC